MYLLEKAKIEGDLKKQKNIENYCRRMQNLLTQLRRGTTCYIRASSLSNIKILGIDYIQKQINSTLDETMLNTSIFAVRQNRVKDMFFGKFGPMYINSDSYRVERLMNRSLAEVGVRASSPAYNNTADKLSAYRATHIADEPSASQVITCADMLHCDLDRELYIGYDPGPFSSLVVAQYSPDRQTFYVLKSLYCYWPSQQPELVEQFARFFSPMRCKTVFVHYDRAGNQHDPKWLNQPTIRYRQHLHLLTRLFSGETDNVVNGVRVVDIRIDENECDALISSIYNSPIRRHGGEVELDKSSEKLPYEEQAYNSTQIASALMYLLWGEFALRYLPASDTHSLQTGNFAGFTA